MHAGESKACPQARHIDRDTGEDSGIYVVLGSDDHVNEKRDLL